MRFSQLDRIIDWKPGESITAVKHLTGQEDYLRDHFPKLPIMPGVLMLEALFQASMWLVQKSEQFARPLITLKEASNTKFAGFVQPGQTLTVTSQIIKRQGNEVKCKAQGMVEDSLVVSGRLTLLCTTIEERHPQRQPVSIYTRNKLQEQLACLEKKAIF